MKQLTGLIREKGNGVSPINKTKPENKRCYFANGTDCKGADGVTNYINNVVVVYGYAVNTLENPLKAKVLELYSTTENDHYEVYHINKLKKSQRRITAGNYNNFQVRENTCGVVCSDRYHSIIHKK